MISRNSAPPGARVRCVSDSPSHPDYGSVPSGLVVGGVYTVAEWRTFGVWGDQVAVEEVSVVLHSGCTLGQPFFEPPRFELLRELVVDSRFAEVEAS